jgi:hypothetical protein
MMCSAGQLGTSTYVCQIKSDDLDVSPTHERAGSSWRHHLAGTLPYSDQALVNRAEVFRFYDVQLIAEGAFAQTTAVS